ncbi:MAG: hypothetical protein KGQ41_02610 [Alphaproteobacteria bacterium]|nr:hypothetical protein [Alphaproteobacteria bacterium]
MTQQAVTVEGIELSENQAGLVARFCAFAADHGVPVAKITGGAALAIIALGADPSFAQRPSGQPGCSGGSNCGGHVTNNIDRRTQVRVEDNTNVKLAVAPAMGSFSSSCFNELFVSFATGTPIAGGVGLKLDYNTTCGKFTVLANAAQGPHCVAATAATFHGGFGWGQRESLNEAISVCGSQGVSVYYKPANPTRRRALRPE